MTSAAQILIRNAKRARRRARFRGVFGSWRRGLFEGVSWPGNASLAVLLSFDIDYEADETALPPLMDALSARGMSASWACIGAWVEARPERYRALADDPWEIINHSQRHPYHELLDAGRSWDRLNAAQAEGEIRAGHETLRRVLGKSPRVFRAPHFAWSPATYEALRNAGYRWSSSGWYSEAAPFGPLPVLHQGVWEFPVYRRAGSYHTLRKGAMTDAEWLLHLAQVLAVERARGGLALFYLDPLDFASRMATFEAALDAVRDTGAWVTSFAALGAHLGLD